MRRRALLAIAVLGLGACGDERATTTAPAGAAPAAVSAALGGQVVARVGATTIDRTLVAEVARARGLSASDALRVLVDEAVLAEAARREGGVESAAARVRTASTLARAMTTKIRDAAVARGPFTDEEIAEALGDLWIELERPETRVAAHALIRKEVPGGAELAKRLHEELSKATGPDAETSEKAFFEAAKAFALPAGHAVHFERLEPFTIQGKIAVANMAAEMNPTFSKATFAIPAALGTSDVVETPFGWHVIRLLEILPPKTSTREEKLAKLGPQLVAVRVAPIFEAELAKLRVAAQPVVLAKDADLVSVP